MDEDTKKSLKILAGFCTVAFLLGAFIMWAMLSVDVRVQ